MVTLTSLRALYALPPALTTAITAEVFCILIRVATNPLADPFRTKLAANGLPFFSAKILIDVTPAMDVVTVTGTTAPFSAISGALILMSPLVVVVLLTQLLHEALVKRFISHHSSQVILH